MQVILTYADKNGNVCKVAGDYLGTTTSGMCVVQQTENIRWFIPQSYVLEMEEEKQDGTIYTDTRHRIRNSSGNGCSD